MDTTPDPIGALWSPQELEAARERCRERALEAAAATIATVPAGLLEAFRPSVYRDGIVESWLKAHDAFLTRARGILSLPEAVGRERLARSLVLNSAHTVEAAGAILRGAEADVSVLPAGRERSQRLAAARRTCAGGL